MDLPPGPAAPAAVQTLEWVARPTALMRRCHARYGDPFTLRTLWTDGPMVLVSEPADIKRIFAADRATLHAGASSSILEPLAGPHSILVLDGPEHMRQRKLMLPPFHGEALARWRGTIAELTAAELDRWQPGRPVRTYRRMQTLTLEVILRVVFGGGDAELRDAIRRTLDMTRSLPRLVAMSLVQTDLTWRRFKRAIERLDALIQRRIDAAPADGSVLALLRDARHDDGSPPTRAELRDQLVTLLAAGHETTAGSLGWALERLARHPDVLARLRDDGDDDYRDAVIREVLRLRPVLSIAPRKAMTPFEIGGWTLPPGVHVTPCIYLTHRRADLWPEPTAFRPQRFLERPPQPHSFIPFGGGVRRCLGAAFATLEMHEVLRAVAARFTLTPHGDRPERMRRRAITLTPARGGSVIPEPRVGLPATLHPKSATADRRHASSSTT